MSTSKPPKVLLLWPGTEGAAAGNFGVPQLVLLGTYLRRETRAEVEIRDLAMEPYLGPVSFDRIFSGQDSASGGAVADGHGYDVVCFSIYSSFDHLKCWTLAEMVRERWPDAVIVAGGYHASARPLEYVRDGSPFDVCVVGEGEKPLVKIVESVEGGAPLRQQVLGSDPITDLEVLPPSDWSLLDRYRKVARRGASQAQVYLSRGCPFDCAFCMERAKREVSWRSLSVERAVEEIRRLHDFLDLRDWTLYFGDALFGMRKSWRREFLEALAREGIPVRKFWLLIRVDLVEDEDLRLFSEANCGLRFAPESGDPKMLGTFRKSGRLDTYLDRMEHIAERARHHDVPWGANVICGHPGETPDSMRRSAAYLERLFLRTGGTTGFLSVDPFRLYPGSPIDAERDYYERTFGTVFHRPHWWDDGDQEFLAEWIDPSAELTYLERARLEHELLTPILARIEDNFVYGGPARDYFLAAVHDQVNFTSARHRLHSLDRYYAWHRYLGRGRIAARHRRADRGLAGTARELRGAARGRVAAQAGLSPEHPVLDAIERVPRERFVPVDEIRDSTRDVAVALDDSGLATVSAMHAYARSFSLLGVEAGDTVLDLGAGTGYGSALLGELVGADGRVFGVEIDPALVARGRAELDHLELPQVSLHAGTALDPASWPAGALDARKVTVGFALEQIPPAWFEHLAEGTIIVAPVAGPGGDGDGQTRLVRGTMRDGELELELHEAVRYVPTRTEAPAAPAPVSGIPEPESTSRPATRLPVVD